jgi:cellulose synthase/poly-beta-1,6-N-acetylglucosamine synthase-like glycosyltransferase
MTANVVVQVLFLLSVILIWFMLVYQFALCFAGFLYSREAAQEQIRLDNNPPDLPSVSIIVPAHNESMVIEKTVRMLYGLDYPAEKIQLIIVNDASTDDTGAILDRLTGTYPTLKIIHVSKEEGGRGKAAALNRGLRDAQHDLIAIYDADNRPEPKSLRYLAAQFEMDPKLGAALGKFRTLNWKKNILTRFINIEGLSFQWIVQAGRWRMFRISTLSGTNYIIRKDVLTEVGGWDEEALTEDAELSLRVLAADYPIKFVPYAATWEQEPENLRVWFKQRVRWARGNFYLLSKFLPRLKEMKSHRLANEMIYFLSLYFVFVGSLAISTVLFFLCLFGLLVIPIPGPYLEVWLLAYMLFVAEVVLMLSREPGADSISNIIATMAIYFTYSQLWPPVVISAFYLEYIKKEKRLWNKTQRFQEQT